MSVTTAWRYRLCRLITNPLVSLRVRLRLRRTVLPLRARTMTPAAPSPRPAGRYTSPMILTYLLGSLPVSTCPARRWRFRLPDLGLFRCFLPALLRASLPLAVTRKRLRAPLWVFIFGIVVSLSDRQPF